jgi:hypothetical protein
MRNLLKTLAILFLVALLPMRAMAAVTIGFCPSGHQDMAISAPAAHAHDAGEHAQHGDDSSTQPAESTCNVCAEHCSSAAFAPSVEGAIATPPIAQDRTHLAERNAAAGIPDQLDRPPLA